MHDDRPDPAALLRLERVLARRRLPAVPIGPGESEHDFVEQQLTGVDTTAIDAATTLLSASAGDLPVPGDALLMQLLLADYTTGVGRLRAVARLAGRQLARAADALDESRRLQKDCDAALGRRNGDA